MKFNETKSQERLINQMLQAGVEWPDGANFAAQHKTNKSLFFCTSKPKHKPGSNGFLEYGSIIGGFTKLPKLNENWHQCVITRKQYESRDGWITWHGGECPVNGELMVEVELSNGGKSKLPHAAREWRWNHRADGADIIAYRIHKQEAVEPCESAKTCIPDQPTIEQLIAEWKRLDEVAEKSREVAERDQAEFDSAAEAVEEALKRAGWN